MLEYLRIQDLALIEDVELELSPGLNVLTGESGAGKSFILRALDFIMGEKLTKNMVRPGKEKARVEAIFVLDGEEHILRRELSAETGRSRVFVNDSLSGQERIRELAPSLLIHTSQHSQQRLLKPAFHVQLLDAFLPRQNLLQERDRVLAEVRHIDQEVEAIRKRVQDLEQQRELLEYQRHEIDKVAPNPGEEEELSRQRDTYKKQNRARQFLDEAMALLQDQEGGLLEGVHRLQRTMQSLAENEEGFSTWLASLEDVRATLMDLDLSLRHHPGSLSGEADLEKIESRLWELAQLRRRLKRSLEEIVHLKEEIDENISYLDSSGLDLQRLERKKKEQIASLSEIMERINQDRAAAAERVEQDLEQELHRLGFPEHVQVRFQFSDHEVYSGIAEKRPRLMWLPNPGQPPQALDQIASGGELSRFLLAMVGLRSRSRMPTLLFDEVDAGIGGLILSTVGERIRELAEEQQIILITHWPQLARHSSCHFQISKDVEEDETFTRCRRLTEQEIVEELSRMAGGGEHGLTVARTLKDT